MRIFYIFNITEEIAVLTKNYPYNLFKIFENLYYLNKEEYNTGIDILEQITKPLNKDLIKNKIFNKYKNDDFYTVINNKHIYNNLYLAQKSNLYVKSTYMLLKTNELNPTFFNTLKNNNLFACDFDNKDYFWLKELIKN